ncbi:hypothetical protein D3C84_1198690 [compost metagenome]
MGIANRHGEGINAGLIDELACQGRVGEKRFVGVAVQRTAFVTADRAQLRFHRHAHGVTHLHHFPGLANILFIAKG